jgi:hypothetical protein
MGNNSFCHLKIPLKKSFRLYSFPAVLTALFLILILSSSGWAGPEAAKIYFYSTETNINNFVSLKKEFDKYLKSRGPYEFQPFSDRKVFEQHVKGKKRCVLLLSSWHFGQIRKAYSLKPVYVGLRDDVAFQKRILVTGTGSGGVEAALKGPLASASNVQHTRSVLKKMFPGNPASETVRILTVPKDVDALMSVGFEMSKSALVSAHALNNLKNFDPVLHKRLKMVETGKSSLLLIVSVPRNYEEESKDLFDVIKKMPETAAGKKIIKMLDLDDWKNFSPSDEEMLEG